MMTRTSTDALNSYVTDMMALEAHIGQALGGQLSDLKETHPQVAEVVSRARACTVRHIEQLEGLKVHTEAGIGAGIAEKVKRGVAAVVGIGAAAVDNVRGEAVPKALRDDFAAFSLAGIGYTMLHAVAVTVGSLPTAKLAHECMREYAQLSTAIRRLIPRTVVDMLKAERLAGPEVYAEAILDQHEAAWLRDERVRVTALAS
jgi:ferritin-like metal-binding protein YciE